MLFRCWGREEDGRHIDLNRELRRQEQFGDRRIWQRRDQITEYLHLEKWLLNPEQVSKWVNEEKPQKDLQSD